MRSELDSGLNMKVVVFSLSFPTRGREPESNKRSSSYTLRNERCQITVSSKNK